MIKNVVLLQAMIKERLPPPPPPPGDFADDWDAYFAFALVLIFCINSTRA
jgi:hypothetical protein